MQDVVAALEKELERLPEDERAQAEDKRPDPRRQRRRGAADE